jgi:hypothetical protein
MSVRAIALGASLCAGALVVPLAAASPALAGPVPIPPPGTNARNLCAPPADTVGPVADSVTFSRSTIDLDSGSRVQTVTVEASDTSGDGAPSGVARVRIEVQGKHSYSGAALKLTSGTSASGSWTGSFTISKYARPGTNSVTDIDLVDHAGNEQYYPGYGRTPSGPNALSLHPADDPTFAVTGTPATRPPRKPAGTLTAFAIGRTSVNTVTSSRRVQVTARFTGAAPHSVSAQFESTGSSKKRYVFLDTRLHAHHGSWVGEIKIPRWLGRQTLQIHLFAEWGARYRPSAHSYSSRALHRMHFPSTLAVTSGVDNSTAKITSLALSPDPIDSTTGAERVTVTATATDTGSGVRSIRIDGGIRNGINGVAGASYPHAAAGIGFLSSQDFTVLLKKTAGGDWVGSTVVKQCVPSGTYKLSAETHDFAGNYGSYSTKKLAKAGLVSTVDVTSKHGDIAAPYVYSAATYAADHELFLNFSEGVKQVNTSTLTVYALTPASSRYTSPTTVSAIVCSNGTSAVDCSGSGGPVTSAKLTIAGLAAGRKYEVWTNLDQVTTQLTDTNGNPMDWNNAATGVIGA